MRHTTRGLLSPGWRRRPSSARALGLHGSRSARAGSIIAALAAAACALAATSTAADPPAPGRIGFSGLEIYKVDPSASRLRIADLNADGLQDIAIVNNSRATIDLFLQKSRAEIEASGKELVEYDNINEIASDARFRKESILTEKKVFDLLVEDLDGNGRPDIVYYGEPRELVVIRRGEKSDGDVTQKFSIPEARAFGRGLAAGDLNGDKREDLVLLGTGKLHIFYQAEGGKLGEPVEVLVSERNIAGVEIVDLDGNGLGDILLVVSGSPEALRIRFQSSRGLGPELAVEAAAFRSLTTADLTGDGRVEVAGVQGATGRVSVFSVERGPPEGLLPLGGAQLFPLASAEEGQGRGLVLGDVNADGRVDLLEMAPASAQLRLHLQSAEGEILPPLTFPSLADMKGLQVGDVDGDGKPEVVVISVEERSVGVSRWAGSRLSFPRSLPIKGKPSALALAPLDAEAGLEVAVAVEEGGESSVLFLAKGDPFVLREERLKLEGAREAPDRIWFFDANQDGALDLFCSFSYDPLRIYLAARPESGGLPTFTDVTAGNDFGKGLLQGVAASTFATGDLDGDGKEEFFLAKKNFARAFRISSAKALEIVDQFNAPGASAEIAGVAVGDILGNGVPEVVLLDKSRNQAVALAKGAMGTYAPAAEVKVPALRYTRALAVDLNGDGRQDLFLEGQESFAVLAAGGTQLRLKRIAEYECELKNAWLYHVAIGDLSSDGRNEVLVSELRSHLFEILEQAPGEATLKRVERFKVYEDNTIGAEAGDGRAVAEPREIEIADVTGDGKADVVFLIHDRIIIYPQE